MVIFPFKSLDSRVSNMSSVCHWRGHWNATLGQCVCEFPYALPRCESIDPIAATKTVNAKSPQGNMRPQRKSQRKLEKHRAVDEHYNAEGQSLPTCSEECSAHEELYEGIENDLAPFLIKGGITREMLSEAHDKWGSSGIMAPIMIHDGQMYLTKPCHGTEPVAHSDPMLQSTLNLILDLLQDQNVETFPNVDLIINADDYGRVFMDRNDSRLLPILSITRVNGRMADILYPTGDYTNGKPGDRIRKLTYNIGRNTHQYLYSSPWEQKKEVGFFRGRPNTHSRSRLALSRISLEHQDLLDIGLVHYREEHDWFCHIGHEKPLTELPAVPFDKHLDYKYLVSLDGHSYSHRLLRILSLNSLVLKEESREVEFYYHMLRPFEHYVPFSYSVDLTTYKMRDVRTNITETVKWLRRNDALARKIALQGQKLAHTHLCDAARRCYVERLLRRYATTMTFRPTLSMYPHAYLVEDRNVFRTGVPPSHCARRQNFQVSQGLLINSKKLN